MRKGLVVFVCSMAFVFASGAAFAADFDWIKDLNIRAQNDPSGFKAQLAARFKIGDTQVSTVIGNVTEPADAYMVLRLSEMSGQPVKTVEERYHAGKGKGWGKLAKSLGIKPGSPEFHALKRGHDLSGYGDDEKGQGKGKGHGHGHGHGED
jgi:hypothetical protein